jgi:hypothetical protein
VSVGSSRAHLRFIKISSSKGRRRFCFGIITWRARSCAGQERFESLGFVTRQRDVKDRRRYSVIAVPKQVNRVDAMYRKYSRKMAALLETYDDATFEALLQYLNDASALIGEEIAQSAPRR